ncbi:LuxR C-terminal-related transcriptional regulator [Microbacterium rhizosphaerae]|uniref:LuxR C-terminal-related transcriptional regulator n=1 Tax=Microbacterium rhizosphaerae TaxID=1678237 RepID=A0ABZ0SIM4_9MICO|nr:LuxR C-terminal-related transcriptional regulator [Microbacterium rhizosphaerae]WPR88704.1 LuxR C-terminal-related transcriptional regulator [Microbacterium rhizosphaerae]
MRAATTDVSEHAVVARAVTALTQRTSFPLAFGGLEHDGAVHVSAIAGARTRHLEGLVVQASRGLGGRAFVERRPRLALDYRTAKTITHDYDRAILGEGIATLFAVPILVSGRTRGVLYCGSWAQAPVGDAVARPAFGIADEVAAELRIRDEVQRRLAHMPQPAETSGIAPAAREELRESYAELRAISAEVGDAGIRERLRRLERRLAALSREQADPALDVRLSPREIDVLACVALGATNAGVADALGLKEVTIKSYLASAMAKLDVTTRHAAVAKARRAGLMP